MLNIKTLKKFSDLRFDWFEAMYYIFTKNGSFLRFKGWNTETQKLIEKNIWVTEIVALAYFATAPTCYRKSVF